MASVLGRRDAADRLTFETRIDRMGVGPHPVVYPGFSYKGLHMSEKIQVGNDTVIASVGPWLHLVKREVLIDGKPKVWAMASRSKNPPHHANKTPNAVFICAIHQSPQGNRLVLTSEFRVPVAAREIGMPAGLKNDSESAEDAARREFFEETGLQLTVTGVSPPNLYSSAGLTDESVQIVFGTTSGTPSNQHLESSEDIEVILADQSYVLALVNGERPELALSAKTWCLLNGYAVTGF